MAQIKQKLTRFLFPSFTLIIAFSVATMTWFTASSLTDAWKQNAVRNIQTQASVLANLCVPIMESGQTELLQSLLKPVGVSTANRLTIFNEKGHVIADSWDDPLRMEVNARRHEVDDALSGELSVMTRQSYSRNAKMVFVAAPIISNGNVLGAARVAMTASSITRWASSAYWQIMAAGIVVVILASAAAFAVGRRISSPVSELLTGAKKFASGDLKHRLSTSEPHECAALADVMNQMAGLLEARINKLTDQRNELEAVLSGMSEAVLAFDRDERIIRINPAAEKLFDKDGSRIKGSTLQEVIRNSQLQRFVRHTLLQNRVTEGQIVFIGDKEKFLQAHGSPLIDSQGEKIGALIVLNDVTRMKKLEVIRRDFVANVSHELKTPITSIKGFLETLKEGAISDPENAVRFLDIAIKHTDRLIAIIEDLLSLSRVEQDDEKGVIALSPVKISDVFGSVDRAFHQKAIVSGITTHYEADESLMAIGNTSLLEQALGNLVDNAIKYSPADRSVDVKAIRRGNQVVITVTDQGSGIAKEHLGRIFERFYRVDKSRSRKEGGTGLGLSIVKHIVTAHNGTVSVTSSPGAGSVFTIIIPAFQEVTETVSS